MTCPVCGLMILDEESAPTTDYKGKKYLLCSDECKVDFDEDPEIYAVKGVAGDGKPYLN